MSAPAGVAEARTSTALEPTAAQRMRGLRRPALVVGLLVVVAVVLAALRSGTVRGYLDPDAATPSGARALRVLLEERGVEVVRTRASADAAARATDGRTLLVATSWLLTSAQVEELAAARADLVLVEPTPDLLAALAPGIEPAEPVTVRPRDPACTLRAATRAGRAETGGGTFTVTGPAAASAQRCYADSGRAAVVSLTSADGRTTTVLGSGAALTNDRLAREGNAALALNLLGAQDELVWYLPTVELSAEGEGTGLRALLPGWVWLVAVQLAVTVLLVALWRGRRLGPVVVEPLPVVVRAAETTEGRGRLYQRAGARDRAAAALRAASLERLRPVVGHGRGTDPDAVVAAVAARTGRPAVDVAALLYGAAPTDDAALVRLADDLDTLERTVRRP